MGNPVEIAVGVLDVLVGAINGLLFTIDSWVSMMSVRYSSRQKT